MASWQARMAAFIVRRRIKPALGDMRDIARVRAVFETRLAVPGGVRYTAATLGGIAGEWVEPAAPAAARDAASLTLLYIHGGGFVGCSPRTHRPVTAALARQGARVFVPDYRLAPEHPFPAALDDVRAVWQALTQDTGPTERRGTERAAIGASSGSGAATPAGKPPRHLAVAGESAGANLALALMLTLRDAGKRLPDAAALFSPPVDLTGGSPSFRTNSQRDAMFNGEALAHLAEAYLNAADPAQPLVSPLFGELAGLPPLLIHVGADEVLRDDALRLAEKARAAGVQVALEVFPVVPHAWQLLWRLPEAHRSVRDAVRFMREAPRAAPPPMAPPSRMATASPIEAPSPIEAAPAVEAVPPIDEPSPTGAASPTKDPSPMKATSQKLHPRLRHPRSPNPQSPRHRSPRHRPPKHFRRPHRRRRPLRHRRRHHLQTSCPGKSLRDPRGARGDRRHLGPVPLSGHPLRFRHVHARLRASSRGRTRRRSPTARRSCDYIARDRGRARHRPPHPLRPPRGRAPSGRAADARWTVEVAATAGERRRYACGFLLCCSGYYDYDEGYTPELPRRSSGSRARSCIRSSGRDDLDYAGKRVVVIGSGATAVTLVPATGRRRPRT